MSDLWIPQEAPPGMEFLHLAWDPEAQWVACWLMAVTPARSCPTCGTLSDRVHTSYVRQPDELPVGDRRLRFFVVARRFWCDQPECDQQIFCERLEWVPADGRRTLALAQWIIDWALITSAEEAAETAARHGVVVSGDTILRRIRALPDPPQVAPKVVGIDDWALRKGHRYATVIVDLERRQIIDCLSDRSVETVTKWLKAHPSVEVVSRDRAEAYAKTSREGAPKAQPVADRFHVLENFGDALERFFQRRLPTLAAFQPSGAVEASAPSTPETAEATPSHTLRTQRYTEIQARWQRGESISDIAKDLALDRKTVRKYATAPTCPAPTPSGRRSSLLDPYIPQLQTLWEQGERKVEALWAAAKAAGYAGSRVTVKRWVTRHRRQPTVDSPPHRPKPRQVAAWYLSRWDHLSRTTTRPLSLILTDPECQRVYTLTHPLHTIIRYRRGEALTAWLAAAEATKIPELVRFAAGIRHDAQAVRNGCLVI